MNTFGTSLYITDMFVSFVVLPSFLDVFCGGLGGNMTPDRHQEAIEAALKALAARRANRGQYEGSQWRGAVLTGHGAKLLKLMGVLRSLPC